MTAAAFWEALSGVLARAASLAALGEGLAGLAGSESLGLETKVDGRWQSQWATPAAPGRSLLILGDWGRLRTDPAAKQRLAPGAALIAVAAARLESVAAADGRPARRGAPPPAHAQVEQQRSILEAMLLTATAAVVLTDANGGGVQYNPRFAALFGFEGQLPVAMDLGRLRRFFADSRRFVAWLHDLPDTPGRVSELDLKQVAPEPRQLRLTASAACSSDGSLTGRIVVFRDMTQQANVDRMKTELINVVSHELRTPLTSVLGFAELVLIRDLPTDKIRQYVGTIYAEGKRLSALLDDFLDINRLESRQQPYHMRQVQLGPIVRRVAALFASHARHPVEVVLPPSLPPLRADADRLQQALSNLVSNAVKYSPEGGPVRIAAELQPEQQRLVVRIQDEGLGIPEAAIGNLFSKFFRVHRPGHEGIGGTGLGLAIVHEIIRAHGGDIWVESVEGAGSTFSFALPVKIRSGRSPA